MDNVTHSLFGYALGRAAGARQPLTPRVQSAMVWTSVVASNAPDLDLLMRFFVEDPKLSYLVHHRGHTHTLLWAVPMGAIVGLLIGLLHGLRDRKALAPVLGIGALAGLLHIGFDAFNNYGVHPFHPVDSRWFYGDFVFIVEPMLLAVMIPLLARTGRTRLGRGMGWLLAVGLLGLLLGAGVLAPGVGWAQALLLGLAFLAHHRLPVGARATLVAVAAVLLALFGAGQWADAQLRSEFALAHPQERIVDVARSPYPGHPLCWNAVVVSMDGSDGYRARKADLSLAPSLWPAARCVLRPGGGQTAPSHGPGLTTDAFVLGPAFAAPISELRALFQHNCRATRALRFLRAPFWTPGSDAIIGDLRYDREPGLGFSEIELNRGGCGDPDAPWVPPRSGLLDHDAREAADRRK